KVFGDSLEGMAYKGIWFVVVESNSKYHMPAKLGDKLSIEVTAAMVNPKAIKYSFRIFRGNDFLTEGYLAMVCVDPKAWKSTSIPDELANKFRIAEALTK
ncbi:MAG: thioesterase family protein, partial [Conexivisphaerales archaeon]